MYSMNIYITKNYVQIRGCSISNSDIGATTWMQDWAAVRLMDDVSLHDWKQVSMTILLKPATDIAKSHEAIVLPQWQQSSNEEIIITSKHGITEVSIQDIQFAEDPKGFLEIHIDLFPISELLTVHPMHIRPSSKGWSPWILLLSPNSRTDFAMGTMKLNSTRHLCTYPDF